MFFNFIGNKSFGITATQSGNWSAAATWGGSLPLAGQPVIVPAGIIVTVDINTPIVSDITVSGTLTTINTGSSNLTYSGNLTVNGYLYNNGGIEQTTSGRTFLLNGTATYLHNPKNTTLLDETIFSMSNETFSASSNLFIQKWFDLTLPLGSATRVQSSDFGNVTLAIPDTVSWEQDGKFMTAAITGRILGKLTVSSGVVSMDNGNGNSGAGTSDLYLNDVTINGTGSIIFQSGINRPLALITGNFIDTSTTVRPTIISDSCFSVINWTVNGNAIISHNFYGIRGSGSQPGGDLNININSNLTIGGGNVSFIRKCSAPLTINVIGNTTIQGTPSSVRFIEGNTGNFTFSTTNLIVSGGASNVFMGATAGIPQYTGQPNITINNDFIINGTSNTTFMSSDSSTKKLSLIIGGNFSMTAANAVFTGAYSKGALTFKTNNNLTISGGQFIGQADTNCFALDSIIATSNFSFNSGTAADFFRGNYGQGNTVFRCLGNYTMSNSGTAAGQGFSAIYSGRGNLAFYVGGNYLQSNGRVCGIYNDRVGVATGNLTMQTVGTFTMNAGVYRGIANLYEPNNGSLTFTSATFAFTGGNFKGHYSSNMNNATGAFTINGNCLIDFTVAADTFMFIGWTTVGVVVNQMILNFTVNGDFKIGHTGGLSTGTFISSLSNGIENITINGNDTIKSGTNSFNSYPNTALTNAHKVTMLITGNMGVTGGITYLSANNDSLSATVNGNFSLGPASQLTVQAGNTYGIFKIKGGYTQSGGTFYLHQNTLNASYQSVVVDINYDDDAVGNFFHTAGIINFDDNTNSTQNTMNVRSPSISLASGNITMASPGTNIVAGVFNICHIGAVSFNRLSVVHNIQQVEIHINSGCTMTVLTGNLQIASYNNTNVNWLIVNSGAILDLRSAQILAFSPPPQPNSGMKIFGRLRTQHTQGLYNNTTTAAINSAGGMNYFLLTGSVIEYYGVDNQIITGTGVGLAVTSLHKYYNLEINFTGTPDVEFVYPTNVPTTRSVFVRNRLTLTNGELNLDDDHINLSGGRSIIVEKDSANSITKVNGYIRSEVIDSSASVIWKIGSNPGPHIFPFAYSSTVADYIPFTFDLPSGTADTVIVSTYHTAPSNLPYPPPVSHVNNLSGSNNSANTVDRFWYLRVTGSAPTGTLKFVCTLSEMSGIINPRAQRWVSQSWEYPYQGTQSNITNGTQVASATGFNNNWWTLASLSSPLPVSLVNFSGACENNAAVIKWTTASETNNDYFTLLKSEDGINYEELARITGAGNSTSVLNYEYHDKAFNNQLAYYKLIQTDFNGEQTEFKVVAVKGCNVNSQLNVSVISSQGNLAELLISSPDNGDFKISLFTMEGKLMASSMHFISKGNNIISLSYPSINASVYLLRIENATAAISKKIILGLH
ncbi:MAG: hypothetical protein ABIT08_07420 [Bacteroidia bacterium]